MEKQPWFWQQLLNRHSIKNKLLLSLLPFIILTYVVILGMVYAISFHETRAIVNRQADMSAEQRAEMVDIYLDKLRMESEIFMFDADLQESLGIPKYTLGAVELDQLIAEMRRNMLSMIVSYDVNVESLTIKTINEDYYYWKMDNRRPHSEFSGRINLLEEETALLGGSVLFSYAALNQGVVTLTRSIKNPVTDQKLGTLMVDFNLGFLNGVGGGYLQEDPQARPTMVLQNSGGEILYNSSPLSAESIGLLTPGRSMLTAGEKRYRVSHTVSEGSGWDMYLLTNESALYRNIYQLALLQGTLIALSVVAVVFLIYRVSQNISHQFQRFVEKIGHTTDLKQHALLKIETQDEFAELALVYNDMILRIDRLIDTVYAKELLVKNAELKAFQAQINPHFLYNTLDCINGLADLKRTEDIHKTVIALASLMRMSIKGEEILTVGENLYYTDQYMYIEKLRYGERLLYLCEVPREMLHYELPKLLLQPILENAVIHGLSQVLGQGMVGLYGKEEADCLRFTVRDNGEGMPPEILKILEENPHQAPGFGQESIGLKNIQGRIRLMYGPAFGLTAENPPGGGCQVTLRLPKITKTDPNKGKGGVI